MTFKKLESWAKINLSLNVIKKMPNNYHQIESLVTFVQFSDLIKIRATNESKHKVSFSGKFSKRIKKKNTVTKLLELLDRKKLIKNEKFEIRVTKNIPQKSGMGGGSMNAACILKYLIKKKIVQISSRKVMEIAKKVGADVVFGLDKKNSILLKSGKVIRLKKKLNFYVLIIMPKFGCSTKNIFSKVYCFSKPLYFKGNRRFFKISNLVQSKNDLENIVLKKYSQIKNLRNFLLSLPNVIFARMTGSGSALVAYFKSKKSANNAAKIFKEKYKGYWYITSKTI